jgi:DNA-binding LacI/PurR family transcriptional regulator
MLMMTLPRSRATLKDVANHVGVSLNAASIVLNNTGSSNQVSQSTRLRIIEAARTLGYQPNSAARALVTRRSNAVGIYVDYELDPIEPFTSSLIYGASRACRELRNALILYGRRTVERSADEICAELLSGIADGVVVASWTDPEILQRLETAFLPVIHYPFAHPVFASVTVDRHRGARLALEHLVRAGHKRIMYHGFPPQDGVMRAAAYDDVARELGIDLVVASAENATGLVSIEERELLDRNRGDRPTAVVCWNDEFAYRMLDYCDESGLRVPDDIAVVGYDGVRTFPELKRRLTTVYVPWGQLAHTAVSLLVDIRNGVDVARETPIDIFFQIGDTA